MSIFALSGSIDPDSTMDEDDVFNTKTVLNTLGHFKPPKHGLTRFADLPLIDGVKSFQRANHLRVDGVMKPDGPTAGRVDQRLAEKQAKEAEEKRQKEQQRARLEAELSAARHNREAAKARETEAEVKYRVAVESSRQKSRELETALQMSGMEKLTEKLAEKLFRRFIPPLPSTVLHALQEEETARKHAQATLDVLKGARRDVSSWDAEISGLRRQIERHIPSF